MMGTLRGYHLQFTFLPSRNWLLGSIVLLVLALASAAPTMAQRTYYIDYQSGSDSNSGTSESSPWKTVPGMANSAVAGYSCQAGDHFILKGGVTWDWHIWPFNFGCSGSGTDSTDPYGCHGTGCTYIGVDQSWYSGSTWTRPILSGGDWSNPGTNTTCFYDSANGGPSTYFSLAYQSFVIVDNIELTGACNTTGRGGNNPVAYIGTYGTSNITIMNSYLHRFTYPASVTPSYGDYMRAGSGGHWAYNVIDFGDSGPTTNWAGKSGYYAGGGPCAIVLDHNVFANMTQATSEGCKNLSIHDNYFYNASASPAYSLVHPHLLNDSGCFTSGGYEYFYNNVVDNTGAGQGWQPNGNGGSAVSCTVYMFNSVWTNSHPGRLLNFAPSVYMSLIFNDTMECGADSNPNGSCGPFGNSNFKMYNMHFINNSSGVISCSNCASFTTSAGTSSNATFSALPSNVVDLLIQSLSTANGQGFSYGQSMEFSPTASSGSTVGKGVNLTSTCNAIPDAAARAACSQDTTYAVQYNQANHTATPYPKTMNNRPTSGSWDIGAYQFGSGSSSASVNPPTGLVATVQ